MTSTTRIALAAGADFEARLRAAVPELNGNLQRWPGSLKRVDADRCVSELMAFDPEIVAFGPEVPTALVLAIAGHLDELHPDVEMLIVAEPSPELWQHAARAGVREIVSPDAPSSELNEALQRAVATVTARRQRLDRSSARQDERPSDVIVVRSPKGGSGKTMVATNVAVALAHQHPGQVAIVDLDLQFGDVASALGLEPHYTIADATANDDLTPTALKALLSTHSSNLYALCAPVRPTDATDITGDDVTAVLALLQHEFRYVIVDTGGGLDEPTLAALAVATQVVLVCSMDVSSVRALRKELEVFDGAAVAPARRHVVLNRANSRVGLEVRDIEATIGRPIDLHLASSRSVPLNMNCGIPVVDAEPTSPVSRNLKELVGRLGPVPAAAANRSWRKRR